MSAMDKVKNMVTKGSGDSATSTTTTDKSFKNTFDKSVDHMYFMWDDFCDNLEESDNEHIEWFSKNVLRRLSIEAPVVVAFVFACTIMHLVSFVLPGGSLFLGVDDFFEFTNPMHYIRQVSHIFMHDGLAHLRGNMTHMLLVGPSSEAVFGSINMIYIIIIVAISSAWAHILIGQPRTRQLGASGVCFAVILLNSLVSAKRGKIPVSFLLTAIWWLGDELIDLFFSGDGVSHHAHLVGGIVGAAAGYYLKSIVEDNTSEKTQAGAVANMVRSFVAGVTPTKKKD